MFHVPEKFRVTNPRQPYASDASYGNNGFFKIDHYKIDNYWFNVMASDGENWEHASVSIDTKIRQVTRCPTWEEMCYIKSLFWDSEDCVIQFHPPEKDYVSMHHYCLHLWRSTTEPQAMPPSILVGINLKAV